MSIAVRYMFGVQSRLEWSAGKFLKIFNLQTTDFGEARSVNPQVPGSSPGRGARICCRKIPSSTLRQPRAGVVNVRLGAVPGQWGKMT